MFKKNLNKLNKNFSAALLCSVVLSPFEYQTRTNPTCAPKSEALWGGKMAASSCEDFWQCIDEMKSQIQSAWRIAQLTRQADKEGENSVVTLQHLSR